MHEFFETLDETQKRIFLDPTNNACPRQLTKVNPFKFFKFFNHFLCFKGGPRAIHKKSGLSPNLLNNMPLRGNVARTYRGGEGAHSHEEIIPILNVLNMTEHDVMIAIRPKYFSPTRYNLKWLYSVVVIRSHALTIFNHGIFDSNYNKIIRASEYPTKEEILQYAVSKYEGNSDKVFISFHVFITRDVSHVHPKCERVYQNNSKVQIGTPANKSYYKRKMTSQVRRTKFLDYKKRPIFKKDGK